MREMFDQIMQIDFIKHNLKFSNYKVLVNRLIYIKYSGISTKDGNTRSAPAFHSSSSK